MRSLEEEQKRQDPSFSFHAQRWTFRCFFSFTDVVAQMIVWPEWQADPVLRPIVWPNCRGSVCGKHHLFFAFFQGRDQTFVLFCSVLGTKCTNHYAKAMHRLNSFLLKMENELNRKGKIAVQSIDDHCHHTMRNVFLQVADDITIVCTIMFFFLKWPDDFIFQMKCQNHHFERKPTFIPHTQSKWPPSHRGKSFAARKTQIGGQTGGQVHHKSKEPKMKIPIPKGKGKASYPLQLMETFLLCSRSFRSANKTTAARGENTLPQNVLTWSVPHS